jgi:hypothetical protein
MCADRDPWDDVDEKGKNDDRGNIKGHGEKVPTGDT